MQANLNEVFATINVYNLLPILRLANVAADSATEADKAAYAKVWSDLKDATGWDDEELAESIVESSVGAQP
jgi:hypothetical protein